MSRSSGTSVSILIRNFRNSMVRCRRCRLEMTVPSAVLKAANRLVVRFELESAPDPADRRGRKTRLPGHRCAGPMGRVLRGGFQRVDHDLFYLVGGHRRHPARAGLIPEPIQSQFKKPPTPFPDRLLCDAFPDSDFLVRQTFRAAEH